MRSYLSQLWPSFFRPDVPAAAPAPHMPQLYESTLASAICEGCGGEVVTALINRGADPYRRNSSGWSILNGYHLPVKVDYPPDSAGGVAALLAAAPSLAALPVHSDEGTLLPLQHALTRGCGISAEIATAIFEAYPQAADSLTKINPIPAAGLARALLCPAPAAAPDAPPPAVAVRSDGYGSGGCRCGAGYAIACAEAQLRDVAS